jgi:hypothetical protein
MHPGFRIFPNDFKEVGLSMCNNLHGNLIKVAEYILYRTLDRSGASDSSHKAIIHQSMIDHSI